MRKGIEGEKRGRGKVESNEELDSKSRTFSRKYSRDIEKNQEGVELSLLGKGERTKQIEGRLRVIDDIACSSRDGLGHQNAFSFRGIWSFKWVLLLTLEENLSLLGFVSAFCLFQILIEPLEVLEKRG